MAIKIHSEGTIPAITLDHVQYDQLHITVSRTPPYTISLSAKTVLYGEDTENVHHYKDTVKDINIPDIDAYIATLDAQQQLDAGLALKQVQEGLGKVAEIYHGYAFIEYD